MYVLYLIQNSFVIISQPIKFATA